MGQIKYGMKDKLLYITLSEKEQHKQKISIKHSSRDNCYVTSSVALSCLKRSQQKTLCLASLEALSGSVGSAAANTG